MTVENPAPSLSPEKVGVIFVHGIGEQRRYEHLDAQARQILEALKSQGTPFTVEIIGGSEAALHADQDTWAAGSKGPVRIVVGDGQRVTHHLYFHEVWWGDVNERSSLAKQIRFWLWALAVWAYPVGTGRVLHGSSDVTSPSVPGQRTTLRRLWHRSTIFLIGLIFALGGMPISILVLLIQRLFNLRSPGILKTLTNYVSGLKLYNQHSRYGPEFAIHPANDDFLDTLGEPPRVSIRRRMIRTLATVAEAQYDRWYVVAHSLGTVIALNGLMETPYAWPGYFVEAQWRAFCEAGFGGPGDVLNRGEHTMPVRPVWALPDELAYRRRIFEKFRGLLTLGSPLEKYAAIWPARVPLSRMPAFQDGAVWVNVFDPIDPVSSPLKAFGGHPEAILPVPVNIGYTSSWAFLLAHLCYLKWSGASGLADGVANWLLTGDALYLLKGRGRFGRGSRTFWCRTLVATAWYGAVFVCLCFLAGWTLRGCDAGFTPGLPERWSWFGNVWQWLWQPESLAYAGLAIACGTAVTLILGTVSYALLFKGKADAPSPPTGGPPLPDPGLPPRS